MASIVLSQVGATAGAQVGGPIGSVIGAYIGKNIGGSIDNALFGSKVPMRHGPRLAELGVQTSTYGQTIPEIYGSVRISGNIIWARPIKEVAQVSKSSSGAGGKGSPGKATQKTTTYSYYATLAVAVCAGQVGQVLRIWADAKQLDVSAHTIRIYNGSEEQLPDSLIQSFEGASKTPAYRGLCYVVFEDFPLADYGNRIPNFTFEVQKNALQPDYNGMQLEDELRSMVLIPGAGEFVYDTRQQSKVPGVEVGGNWIEQVGRKSVNQHSCAGKTNVLLALDQLKNICPNVDYISVVVAWFGSSMSAADCTLMPGVEFDEGAIISPDAWSVAGYNRETARLITQIDGTPQYGGTPSDASVLRLLDELAARGYKVAFYPMPFMDVAGKPWRGELTGNASEVADFFTRPLGYNAFVNHYATLVAGKVDAFIISSELKGLTKVSSTPGVYPAVSALVSLAASCRATLGGDVKLTYAADWSEYHHTDGGWYHLDPLWASPDIDVIGIDAYFPLTDSPSNSYNIAAAELGWTSGEGYDWYYSDAERTTQTPLAPEYAWKNLAWFWGNTHHNPGGAATAWVPESKKIWFTEFGFPSVDCATNQPNVFYDPSSVSSGLPYYSRGRVDMRAQRTGMMATLSQWKDSPMVERMFAWTWDARPYPYWPDLKSIWADGAAWKTGHWLQGKLGLSSLAAIVQELCLRAGLSTDDIDVSALQDRVDGFVINQQQTLRSAIEALQQAYFFDSVESDHVLKFVPRGADVIITLTEAQLLPAEEDGQSFSITRAQEVELPSRVNLIYMNRLLNYQSSAQYSSRQVTQSREIKTLDLPIVMNDQQAKTICDVTLFSDWVGRTSYSFDLPIRYSALEPSDIISVQVGGKSLRMRIVETTVQSHAMMRINAIAEDQSTFDFYAMAAESAIAQSPQEISGQSNAYYLDLPLLPGASSSAEAAMHIAAMGANSSWTGAAIYRSDDAGASYNRITDVQAAATMGVASTALAAGAVCVLDEKNTVEVVLGNSEASMHSISHLALLNGENAALLGDEIIQFKTATLISAGKYRLSGLLRGRLGTEWAIGTHAVGERFVLLDGAIEKQPVATSLIGLGKHYKAVSFGSTLSSATAQNFTFTARGLKPYSPVHVAATRDGSGNITLSWQRRTRTGGSWQDYADVPLGEESERYDVDIYDGSDVVRSISGITSPSASYSAAEQVADFGAVQPAVTIRIYQLSSTVGRGYPALATI